MPILAAVLLGFIDILLALLIIYYFVKDMPYED